LLQHRQTRLDFRQEDGKGAVEALNVTHLVSLLFDLLSAVVVNGNSMPVSLLEALNILSQLRRQRFVFDAARPFSTQTVVHAHKL